MAASFFSDRNPYPVDAIIATMPPPPSTAVNRGDIMYNVNGVAYPASSLADPGTAELAQAAIARDFLGIALTTRRSTDTTTVPLEILVDRIYLDYPCDSSTFVVGDDVGVAYSAGAVSQRVAKVSSAYLAIGKVEAVYTAATTTVFVRFTSKHLMGLLGSRFRDIGGVGQGFSPTVQADGAVTLTVASTPVQTQTPTVARTWTLPAVASSKGLRYFILNSATGNFPITVQNVGATVIAVVGPGQIGELFCDGATWYGQVGSSGSGKFGLRSYTDAITAGTTQTQAGGTPIVAELNSVTTANANDGVTLPVSIPGMVITIYNATANTVKIYPNAAGTTTEVINALAANAAYSLATVKSVQLGCTVAGQWRTLLSA